MTTSMDKEKPAPAVKPIGPTEALERATSAARNSEWEQSVAWSSLGMLALGIREVREERSRGRQRQDHRDRQD